MNFHKYYKTFLIFIFKKIYGSVIYKKKNINNSLKTNKTKIQNKLYNSFEMNNCRIFTNTNDVAYISNNNIIYEGPSIQIRGHTYCSPKVNVTLKKGTPKFVRIYKKKIFSLLSGAHGNSNYFHWLFDVLPRIFILKKIYKIKSDDFFIVPNYLYKFQKETLKLLGINNIINAYKKNHIKADKVISVHFDVSQQNNFRIPIWVIKFLKIHLKVNSKNSKKYEKIYIDRNDSLNTNLRKIENEDEIKNYLKKKGFKFLQLSNLEFLDEIRIFNNAKIVIGLYGAGLSNVIYCKKNTSVIEIRPNGCGNLYKNLIKDCGLKYGGIECKKSSYKKSDRNFDGSIRCSLSKLTHFVS
jgi:hypothetical protein